MSLPNDRNAKGFHRAAVVGGDSDHDRAGSVDPRFAVEHIGTTADGDDRSRRKCVSKKTLRSETKKDAEPFGIRAP
jgi:hypothetical protein